MCRLVILLYRVRAFPPAHECTKCGKLYELESGFGESTVYCSQCVSVFQKRDVVSIEQQTAKLGQIKTWERWTALLRRLVDSWSRAAAICWTAGSCAA